MTTIKKLLSPLFTLSIVATLFSCNSNSETTKEEPKKVVESTAATTPAVAFTPFNVALIKHTVKDYAKWRPFFDADDSIRKAMGMSNIVVGRGTDNMNALLLVFKVADVQKAKDFTATPKLKEVMQKAGVISAPEFAYYNVIRFDSAADKLKEWVEITHKVKDFDAWVKVYDAEGKDKRASEGMLDGVLARGIDDPNIVHIVFAITDMAKAKAAIASEAKKKLMLSAGVEGVPTIEFYKNAD